MHELIHEEKQTFPVTAFLVAAVFESILIGGLLMALILGTLPVMAVVPPLIVVTTLSTLLYTLFFLKTRLYADRLDVQLGLLPLIRKNVPLEEITAAKIVDFSPTGDGNGKRWGVGNGRWDGAPCTYFTARGNKGVLLTTRDGAILIGSQEPDLLLQRLLETAPAIRSDA